MDRKGRNTLHRKILICIAGLSIKDGFHVRAGIAIENIDLVLIPEGIRRLVPGMPGFFDHHSPNVFAGIFQSPHEELALVHQHVPFADVQKDIVG